MFVFAAGAAFVFAAGAAFVFAPRVFAPRVFAPRVFAVMLAAPPALRAAGFSRLRAMAARTRPFSPSTLSGSPSDQSMARQRLPFNPALKTRLGSGNWVPLGKVIFTTFL